MSDPGERAALHRGYDRWLWINRPYDHTDPALPGVESIELNPIHVGDGRQYVYWEVLGEFGTWVAVRYLPRAFQTVYQACRVLNIAGAPGVTYRLVRFDKTPLLTARAGPKKWVVKKWVVKKWVS